VALHLLNTYAFGAPGAAREERTKANKNDTDELSYNPGGGGTRSNCPHYCCFIHVASADDFAEFVHQILDVSNRRPRYFDVISRLDATVAGVEDFVEFFHQIVDVFRFVAVRICQVVLMLLQHASDLRQLLISHLRILDVPQLGHEFVLERLPLRRVIRFFLGFEVLGVVVLVLDVVLVVVVLVVLVVVLFWSSSLYSSSLCWCSMLFCSYWMSF